MAKIPWMAAGPYGVMVHWVKATQAVPGQPYIADWNAAVDAFDVDAFCDRVAATGAKWLIFPFGHVAGGGYFASPNAVIDARFPGHCSKRDLVLEIARGVTARGLKFIGYLFTEFDAAGNISDDFADAMDWNRDLCDKSAFMEHFYSLVAEWALRCGPLLAGWWFDGCYKSIEKGFIKRPGWDNSRFDPVRFASAARSGNPAALISMCPGANSFRCVFPEIEDYLAGEANNLAVRPVGPLLYGLQWHALVWIDCFWAHEKAGEMDPPRFFDVELLNYLFHCRGAGGGVTLNIGIFQDGSFGPRTEAQLHRLKNVFNAL